MLALQQRRRKFPEVTSGDPGRNRNVCGQEARRGQELKREDAAGPGAVTEHTQLHARSTAEGVAPRLALSHTNAAPGPLLRRQPRQRLRRTRKNKVPPSDPTLSIYLQLQANHGNRVLAQVSASVVKPYDDSPFEGIFTISTEFSPMAAASFEPARVGPYELLLSRTLDNTLRRARAIDLESLCILAKKLVWSVRVDVHFLDHDGGLVDAACVAVVAALLSFRRPDVEVRGEQVQIVSRPPDPSYSRPNNTTPLNWGRQYLRFWL